MPAIQSPTIPLIGQASNIVLLSFFLTACVSAYVVYQRFFHPLASVPGPFWASLSRLWITKHSWDGDMHRTMIALHEKHGPIVRNGPNEVSIADLSAIKTIYGAGTKFRKSDWYSVWQGHRKFDLFAEKDEKLHGKQRSLISSAYSMTSLKDLEPYVDDSVKRFLDAMSERQNQVVDMGKWAQLFAFDVIGEITFSKSFGFMDAQADDGSFAQIEGALQSAAWIGQVPWLYWLHDRLMPIIGNRLALNNRHGSLRILAAKEISARMDRGSERKDILSKLHKAQSDKPGELDDNAVISMATSNIFAGSDTTAISTRAIIYYLLKNPQYKQRLIEEIDDFRRQGKLSNPVKLAEADAMPYLQATVVGANPWVIHRNKEVYGEDVEDFRPDRWLKEDTGDMRRFFFTFGSGARMCLGRNISWMEMSKLIPTLFLHYNIELADQNAEWKETCFWFVMQQGVNVRLVKRNVPS
ncbi:cytochrome P450 [Aureobasidium pullulans]|uniref:Cytochrome P450 n=1 Tax=Aureobasidium pullulans TaxID=5580 RepID=A0A4S9D8G7_AURPU|nr:cytochrome P450 [Aureobasidium pullulans]